LKTYGELRYSSTHSQLDRIYCSGCFVPGNYIRVTHWKGVSLGAVVGMDVVRKIELPYA